jgi:hypothetical protein
MERVLSVEESPTNVFSGQGRAGPVVRGGNDMYKNEWEQCPYIRPPSDPM